MVSEQKMMEVNLPRSTEKETKFEQLQRSNSISKHSLNGEKRIRIVPLCINGESV